MSTPRGVAPGEAGMTLLELLVALTITGLMLAAGYGALGSALDHRERMVRAADEVESAARVRASLRGWLSGARLTPESGGPEFQGIDAAEGERASDELSWLTSATTPLGPMPTIVRLFLDRDQRTPERGLVAELSEWRGARAARVELAPQATGLEVRYLSTMAEEQLWTESWISSSVLPAALELRLEGAGPDSLPPLLRLPLLVPLGAR